MELNNTENSADTLKLFQNERLGMCEVCSIKSAKYTCPRCELKTCCLNCVKIHKMELKCNGERNKAKYISKKKFTDLDLLNDYRYLEEVNRSIESLSKDMTQANYQNLPTNLHKLKTAAAKQNITLKFLPKKFSKRRDNTSYLNYKTKIIFWHIKWVFTNANNITFTDTVPETTKLSHLLEKYLVEPQESETLQEQLKYYQSRSTKQLNILLHADEKPGTKYYELDISKSLQDNLKNKTIIEHPIIYVLFSENVYSSSIIESDDEFENTGKKDELSNTFLNYHCNGSSDESD